MSYIITLNGNSINCHQKKATIYVKGTQSNASSFSKILGVPLKLQVEGLPGWSTWLRLCAPSAGGMGLIPGSGTKFLHATRHAPSSQKSAGLIS